jgi:hypothetical protein
MSRHAAPAAPEPVTLESVHAEIVELRELVERLVVAPPSSERSWLSIDEAAALVNRTPQAVRLRCRINKIGLKVNGVWRVDRARLLSHF